MQQQWYSVRSIFRRDRIEEGKLVRLFEERVVVFRAASGEEALAKGRAEAQRYAASETQPTMLDHVVAFGTWAEELREGEEVWSCLRELDISDADYLDRFYEGERLGLRHFE